MSDQPPKSAVELAMERLRQQDAAAGVEHAPLTEAQKQAIAEAQRSYDAQVAECRILHDSAMLTETDPEKRRELDANYRRELARFATDRDRRIAAARSSSAGAENHS